MNPVFFRKQFYKNLLIAAALSSAVAVVMICTNRAQAEVIGARPAGCPYKFCGCGLRKYLGINDKRLDLAWNWARLFPRTTAHAGAAAVRHGHVMLLVSHVQGTTWTVRDYNGGRHLSYIHDRDVRGYTFVEPSSRTASAAKSEAGVP